MAAKDLATRFFTGLNEHNLEAALSGFDDEAVYHGLQDRDGRMSRADYAGKKRIAEYLGTFLESAAGGYLKYDLRSVQGDDKVVAVEWVDLARSKAGVEYRNQGVNVFQFNDAGKAIDIRMYCDWSPLENWKFTPDK
jgi:ketosteroid isomerase-like protein